MTQKKCMLILRCILTFFRILSNLLTTERPSPSERYPWPLSWWGNGNGIGDCLLPSRTGISTLIPAPGDMGAGKTSESSNQWFGCTFKRNSFRNRLHYYDNYTCQTDLLTFEVSEGPCASTAALPKVRLLRAQFYLEGDTVGTTSSRPC